MSEPRKYVISDRDGDEFYMESMSKGNIFLSPVDPERHILDFRSRAEVDDFIEKLEYLRDLMPKEQ